MLERTIVLAESARRRLQALPGVSVLDADRSGSTPSITKLVIDVDGPGITGTGRRRAPQPLRVGPEMSDLVGVVCLITIGDSEASIQRLVEAFATLSRSTTASASIDALDVARPAPRLPPRSWQCHRATRSFAITRYSSRPVQR